MLYYSVRSRASVYEAPCLSALIAKKAIDSYRESIALSLQALVYGPWIVNGDYSSKIVIKLICIKHSILSLICQALRTDFFKLICYTWDLVDSRQPRLICFYYSIATLYCQAHLLFHLLPCRSRANNKPFLLSSPKREQKPPKFNFGGLLLYVLQVFKPWFLFSSR